MNWVRFGFFYLAIGFGSIIYSGCDPAYQKHLLIKNNGHRIHQGTRLELEGIPRLRVISKIQNICREKNMEIREWPKSNGWSCVIKTDISALHLFIEPENIDDNVNVVLMDWMSFKQSGLSAIIEKELLEFASEYKSDSLFQLEN